MPLQRRHWLRTAEVTAWSLGAALLMSHAIARVAFETARAQGVEALRDAEEFRVDLPVPQVGAIDQSAWSELRVRAFEAAKAVGGTPEAVLAIASVGLEVPVYPGTDELNLNRGAGHIEGTAALGGGGNTGIAAHRDGFFRALEHLRLDADVSLRLGDRELHYRVTAIEVVEPTDVYVLADTASPTITLVTCYPFYFLGAAPQRYIVRAVLVDAAPLLSAEI